jgi:hypothetical protein
MLDFNNGFSCINFNTYLRCDNEKLTLDFFCTFPEKSINEGKMEAEIGALTYQYLSHIVKAKLKGKVFLQ